MIYTEDAPTKLLILTHNVDEWALHTDGSFSKDGLGAGIILVSLQGDKLTYALRFKFSCSNNDAEYEALLAILQQARSMNISKIKGIL